MVPFHVLRLVHVADAEQPFHAQHAFLGKRGGPMLFIHRKVARCVLFTRLFAFDYFAANQVR